MFHSWLLSDFTLHPLSAGHLLLETSLGALGPMTSWIHMWKNFSFYFGRRVTNLALTTLPAESTLFCPPLHACLPPLRHPSLLSANACFQAFSFGPHTGGVLVFPPYLVPNPLPKKWEDGTFYLLWVTNHGSWGTRELPES